MTSADDRWWGGLEKEILGAVAPGARVLDVGCGDGKLVRELVASGLDAIGVDPQAPDDPRLVRCAVEELEGAGTFDIACAVMSLHHAALEPVCAAIVRLLRPGGRLLVSEFSWEMYDKRAAAWLDQHDRAGRDNSVAAWREKHADLHTGPVVRAALETWFRTDEQGDRPYLARMLGRRELEADEQARIDDGTLPALGRWWAGTREI